MKIIDNLKLRFGSKDEKGNVPEEPTDHSAQHETPNAQPETAQSEDWSPGEGPPLKSEIPHSDSQLSTLNAQLLKQRQPTGKVGKLPKVLRNQVNQWLDDCVTYKKICANLEELGYPGFVHQNIQRWKDNGYQNHLREEQRRQDLIECLEANERLGTDPNPAEKVAKATETLMTLRMHKLMDKTHDQTDEELMGEKSKPFFTLCGTVLKVMAHHQRNARLQLDAETREKRAAIQQALTKVTFDPKVGPSKEQREAIIGAVENVLGVNLDPAEIEALLAGKYPPHPSVLPSPQGGTSRPVGERGTQAERPDAFGREGEGTVQTEQPARTSIDTTSLQSAVTPSDIPHSALATPHLEPSVVENPIPPSERLPSTPECTVTKELPAEPPIIPHSALATPHSADPWSPAPRSVSSVENTKPETQNAKQRRFPVSPLAPKPPEPKQPYGTVPILDCCGAVIDWIPQKGEGSQPPVQDAIGFHNRYRETICWVHPKDPYRDRGIPEPIPRKSPILNVSGMIVGWFAGHPDALRPPSATSEPLNSRRLPRGIVAWIDERRDYFQ